MQNSGGRRRNSQTAAGREKEGFRKSAAGCNKKPKFKYRSEFLSAEKTEECVWIFFNSAIEVLQTLVVALGAGLGIWGAINLLEGYGNDNPGAKSQGMKQLMAGGGVALIGMTLVPLLSGLFG